MVKHFCDCCGRYIDKQTKPSSTVAGSHSSRLGGAMQFGASEGQPPNLLIFEIMTGTNQTWNAGEFCKYCVIDAVKKLDDRPNSVGSRD